MKRIIQFKIYKGEKYFVDESSDLPIVNQEKTIDETVQNIREALALCLEGEDLSKLDIESNSLVLVNFELEPLLCA
jgi:predicted RNase H-like HicB family nuclease